MANGHEPIELPNWRKPEDLAHRLVQAVERYETEWGSLYAEEIAKALSILQQQCIRPSLADEDEA